MKLEVVRSDGRLYVTVDGGEGEDSEGQEAHSAPVRGSARQRHPCR
jgi:hypothetical protein